MKKILTSILCVLSLTTALRAADVCPFAMPNVALPYIPDRQVLITDFGAKGDGGTLCTEAFGQAMQALAKQGGGRLIVPPGIWLTGPIQFENNCELHVENGALVFFTTDFDAYPMVETIYEGKKSTRKMSPLWAYEKHDVAITGKGSFDGQGQYWRPSKKVKFTAVQWEELTSGQGVEEKNIWYPDAKKDALAGKPGQPDMRRVTQRPTLLEFTRCQRVLLQDATFSNSPAWNVHPLMCEDITLERVNIRNPWYAQNGDGLDLESANRAIVRDCTFDVGDDAICIKSGKDAEGRSWQKPCQNVIIEGCTVLHGHGGFVIGSEMSSGAQNIWVHNCLFNGTDTGLRMKSTRGRGGVVENIYIDHINMVNIATDAFTFDLYYANKPAVGASDKDSSDKDAIPAVTEETPSFRKLYISNVVCQGANRAVYFNGLPEMPISELSMSNSLFVSKKGAELHYAKNITFEGVTIINSVGAKYDTDSTVLLTVRSTDGAGDFAARTNPKVTKHDQKEVAQQKTSVDENSPIEVCATAMLSRGYYEKKGKQRKDWNASGELTALYHTGDWAFGLATGLYHTVGSNGNDYIPTLAVAEYQWDDIWRLRPIVQAYMGAMWGVSQKIMIKGQDKYPNCAMGSLRGGLLYPLGDHLSLQCTMHLYQLTNNSNSYYSMTSMTNAGVSGGMRYRF